MKITKKDQNRLWGDGGPYSEAHLIFETRILDDSVSRMFLTVHVHINPYTFETVRKNRRMFMGDKTIQDILEYAEYIDESEGYFYVAYEDQYLESKQLEDANYELGMCERAVINMHRFVLTFLKKRLVH